MQPDSPSNKQTGPLSRRNYELSILKTIAEALNGSVDLDQILQETLSQLAELLELPTGWIWLLQEDSGESYLAAAKNLPPALTKKPERMAGSCFCLDTYREGDMDGAEALLKQSLLRLMTRCAGLRYLQVLWG